MLATVVILDAEHPPAGDVAWRCWTIVGKFREDTLMAHSWFEARTKAAALFGAPFESVDAVQSNDAAEREDEQDAKARQSAAKSYGRIA